MTEPPVTPTTAGPVASLPRESVACDICNAVDEQAVCIAQSLYSEERFNIVQCRRCGLIYVNPRQQEAAKLAQIAALSGFSAVEENQIRDTSVYQIILGTIGRRLRRGRLLDVGAATGGLLRDARDRGWEVAGVEAARPLAEFAARNYGLDVFPGTLEEARFPDGAFDVVVMVHTIEHLYHPSRVVREVFRVLKPGGYFYSMTPDYGHYAIRLAQVFGYLRDSERLDPTAHPYYFTPKTHRTLVERQGFKTVWCGSPVSGLIAQRRGGESWQRSLARVAVLPAVWVSQLVPIGSTIQMLAQKPQA